jgi:hypothetical protein
LQDAYLSEAQLVSTAELSQSDTAFETANRDRQQEQEVSDL